MQWLELVSAVNSQPRGRQIEPQALKFRKKWGFEIVGPITVFGKSMKKEDVGSFQAKAWSGILHLRSYLIIIELPGLGGRERTLHLNNNNYYYNYTGFKYFYLNSAQIIITCKATYT